MTVDQLNQQQQQQSEFEIRKVMTVLQTNPPAKEATGTVKAAGPPVDSKPAMALDPAESRATADATVDKKPEAAPGPVARGNEGPKKDTPTATVKAAGPPVDSKPAMALDPVESPATADTAADTKPEAALDPVARGNEGPRKGTPTATVKAAGPPVDSKPAMALDPVESPATVDIAADTKPEAALDPIAGGNGGLEKDTPMAIVEPIPGEAVAPSSQVVTEAARTSVAEGHGLNPATDNIPPPAVRKRPAAKSFIKRHMRIQGGGKTTKPKTELENKVANKKKAVIAKVTPKKKAAKSVKQTPPKMSNSMVFEGPPDETAIEWPEGWVKRVYKRKTGASSGGTDRYWYTPVQGFKLRSMMEVKRFMKALEESNGDESRAKRFFKGIVL